MQKRNICEKTESKLIANVKDQSFKSTLRRIVCVSVCESAKLKKEKRENLPPLVSRVLPLPSPRRAAAAAAAAALTLQSHPAAESDAEEQAEHIRYTPSTNNEAAPQHFARRFHLFIYLSFSPPLRLYFAPGLLRWRD